jgi:ubiquinone/menaquinone biosynthesis C-methylase UbiE
LHLLIHERVLPLENKNILDVGCGTGQHLLELESWGARCGNMAGIDLIESRILRARARLASPSTNNSSGADIRIGEASNLPWSDATFDIVQQNTVFTSIIDDKMKSAVAAEMLRVLKPGGIVIWYDFLFNNPQNSSVRGIGAKEIRRLYPRCTIKLKRTTLAPPIARLLVPVTWLGALLVEKMVWLNTHYLGIIRKPND